jgi:hypothetical protein
MRTFDYLLAALIVFVVAGSCSIDAWHKKRIEALEAERAALEERIELLEEQAEVQQVASSWHLTKWFDENARLNAVEDEVDDVWEIVNDMTLPTGTPPEHVWVEP